MKAPYQRLKGQSPHLATENKDREHLLLEAKTSKHQGTAEVTTGIITI